MRDIRERSRDLARRALQQYVARIVIKNGTETLYYTPLQNPSSPSTEADLRHPDKEKLRDMIVTLRVSYREIGREVGLHRPRIGQILKNAKRWLGGG